MASWATFNGEDIATIESATVLETKIEWSDEEVGGFPRDLNNSSSNSPSSERDAMRDIKHATLLTRFAERLNDGAEIAARPEIGGTIGRKPATGWENGFALETNRERSRILGMEEEDDREESRAFAALIKREASDATAKVKRPETLFGPEGMRKKSRREGNNSSLPNEEILSKESREKIERGEPENRTDRLVIADCDDDTRRNSSVKHAHHVQFNSSVDSMKSRTEAIFRNGKTFGEQQQSQQQQQQQQRKEKSQHSSPSITTSSSRSSEDDSSLERYSEARPPDGGWGWVVVAASFMVNLIADGITFSFGVIYVEFLNYFGEGKSKTAWIGSLFMAMPLLSGPVASFMTDRYGCRKVSIAGSILATTGFVVSSYASSMQILIFTFGIVAGFGLSLCFVAAVVIVAYYFDKKRSFATGLSVCGSGIGTFIFAPVTQYLLDEYGWRGTTLVLAGLFLNLAVCGCLMRDLEWTQVRARAKTAERRANRERERTKRRGRAPSSSADSFSAASNAVNAIARTVTRDGERERNFASANAMNVEARAVGDRSNENENDEDEEDERNRQIRFRNQKYPRDPSKRRDASAEEREDSKLFSSLVSLPTFVKNGEKVPLEVLELLSNHKNVYDVLLQNYPSLLISSRSFTDSGAPLDNETLATGDKVESPAGGDEDAPRGTVSKTRNGISGEVVMLEFGRTEIGTNDKDIEKIDFSDKNWRNRDAAYLWWLRKIHPNNPSGRAAPIFDRTDPNGRTDTNDQRLPTAYLKDIRVHRHSLTYRGAMLNINRYRLRASSCPNIYRNSITTIAKTKLVWYAGLWEFWDLVVDMLDFSHFADSRFLLFSISNFLLHTWYDVPYVYLTDNAIEVGFSETDASILISVIGIMNMSGEIFLGWAGDRAWVNASLVYAACMILCGAVTGLIPMVVKNYWGLCTVSGAFGLFIAANYSLTSIILVEVITLERFTNAYGLLLLVQGIANLMGPPLAGWLYDITGSYDLSFYLAGFFIALSGILMMIMPLMEFYRKCKIRRDTGGSSNDKKFTEINSV